MPAQSMRLFNLVARWLERMGVKRFDIGRNGDPYLTRWVLVGERFTPQPKVFLHYFHRSDYAGALHDHPWAFESLVIWPGYHEHTNCELRPGTAAGMVVTGLDRRIWAPPLSFIRRPAEWRHRVQIDESRGCWTLVITGPKTRHWGFWCLSGFRDWRTHSKLEEAGMDGCE